MKSSIFLNDISVIDHAYIDEEGQVIGGSFHCSFIVTGETDPTEKVVVDFSTIKKDIKNIIDGENGFDHKLWIFPKFSNYNIPITLNKTDPYSIMTPSCHLILPVDSVAIISHVKTYSDLKAIGHAIAFMVEDNLSDKYKDIDLKITCILKENFVRPANTSDFNVIPFRYVHGLKNSTSYGCQNLCHGHYSYIVTVGYSLQFKEDFKDNVIFINRENIINETNDYIEISYTTEQRGYFYGLFYKNRNVLIILDTETTIEFLAEYVKDKYSIKEPFYISEGLSKGAYIAQ